jgi:hypothetical protein
MCKSQMVEEVLLGQQPPSISNECWKREPSHSTLLLCATLLISTYLCYASCVSSIGYGPTHSLLCYSSKLNSFSCCCFLCGIDLMVFADVRIVGIRRELFLSLYISNIALWVLISLLCEFKS